MKQKLPHPALAKDLYTSPLFRARRQWVEATCDEWAILSAAHGLVAPDTPLEPYDETLTTASIAVRRAWARNTVAAALHRWDFETGSTVEIHAGSAYCDYGLVGALRSLGIKVEHPVRGLPIGKQLRFYASEHTEPSISQHLPTLQVTKYLSNPKNATSAASLLRDASGLPSVPGLYSWWASDEARKEMAQILEIPDVRSPIYVGQAGAGRGKATLYRRIRKNHLGGNIGGSTFRWTLACLLRDRLQLEISAGRMLREEEKRLTAWMADHLSVATYAFDDRRLLAELEDSTLAALDPPLNLKGMQRTASRHRLRQLRAVLR